LTHITADERRILEDCYRGCPCGGCTLRRELIAKVLAELDAATREVERLRAELQSRPTREFVSASTRDFNEQLAAANALLDYACNEWNRPERWVKRAMAHLAGQPTTAPLTVEAIRGAVLEALSPESTVVHWDSERNGMDDPGAPQYLGSVPRLKPLALVEDRTPEQLAADGDAHE
jgi:hypothetical protein